MLSAPRVWEALLADFKNNEELEGWLRGRPREVSITLAARAALRVLPVVQLGWGTKEYASFLVLPVFRATAISWGAAKYWSDERERAAQTTAYVRASALLYASTPGAAGAAAAAAEAAADAASSAAAHDHTRHPAARLAPRASAEERATVAAKVAKAAARAAERAAAAYIAFSGATAAVLWSAASSDATLVEQGRSAADIAGSRLWHQHLLQPEPLQSKWLEMQAALHAQNQDWQVWTIWYNDRLDGRIRKEERELAYVRIDDALWKQGPAIVNAEIKRRLDELERAALVPPEPSPEPGPVLQVTERGLEIISQPSEGDFDAEVQKVLHDRLRRLLPTLAEATHRVANAHPALDHIVSEYSDLIGRPFDQLDVASLWAVGTGLLAFRAAFANLASGSMTEPLEPGHLALLQQAAELHGGFILGFPKGRELTDRADHARLSSEIIAQIEPPARQILESLARERDFVETRTRKFFAAVDESLVIHGWKTARTGHAAYVVTRNSVIALGKILIRANSALATVVGGTVLNCADPGLQMTQHIIRFMLENAQTIASFAEPFPELRNWLCFLIDHIDREK
ncbi:MAG TPA: hypothetical protein VIE66_09020 [Methylocella sp.]|jgi:hypothetical protein